MGKQQPPKPTKSEPIPKPPRKSKLPEPVNRVSGPLVNPDVSTRHGGRFKKNTNDGQPAPADPSSPYQTSHIPRFHGVAPPENPVGAAGANGAALASKRFKMLRLKKDGPSSNSELGIVISKKRNPQKGTSGYIIAHIEPGGLVER